MAQKTGYVPVWITFSTRLVCFFRPQSRQKTLRSNDCSDVNRGKVKIHLRNAKTASLTSISISATPLLTVFVIPRTDHKFDCPWWFSVFRWLSLPNSYTSLNSLLSKVYSLQSRPFPGFLALETSLQLRLFPGFLSLETSVQFEVYSLQSRQLPGFVSLDKLTVHIKVYF